jgi:hypothetical protein
MGRTLRLCRLLPLRLPLLLLTLRRLLFIVLVILIRCPGDQWDR